VAVWIGKTPGAVRQKRQQLGIINPATSRCGAKEIALLGSLPGREVARLVGRSRCAVRQKWCHFCLTKYAGSALKFASRSWRTTALTYALLGVLAYRPGSTDRTENRDNVRREGVVPRG
jgi:hypothetical protein